MKKLLAILMMLSFWACDGSQQSDAEKINIAEPSAKDLAADERKADMTIPDMTKAPGSPDEIKITTSEKLQNHPLAALDKPEDQQIIKYLNIHNMVWACKPGESQYRQDCKNYIADAVKKCAAAGIKTTEADFRNRAFIERQAQVLEKHKRLNRSKRGAEGLKYTAQCAERLKRFQKGELIR